MIIEINNQKYRIWWKHKIYQTQEGHAKGSTECFIAEIVSKNIAVCSIKERAFNKEIGRKISLQRALMVFWPKEIRTMVWRMYRSSQEKVRSKDIEAQQSLLNNEIFQERLVEALEIIVSNMGSFITEGKLKGYYDSNAMGDVNWAAEQLIAFGLWEKHPDGYARRQFYRPIKKDF